MITQPRIRSIAALALAVSALTLTACDVRELGSYRAPEIRPAPTTAPAAPPKPVAKKPAARKPVAKPVQHREVIVLRAKLNHKYGTLVVDRHGRTLYRGDADRAKPSTSRCHGTCTRLWKPALVSTSQVTVAGLDPDLVATIRRGRSRQLTVAGWPVYTFAHDFRRGDVKGQCGRGFFAVTPEGRRALLMS